MAMIKGLVAKKGYRRRTRRGKPTALKALKAVNALRREVRANMELKHLDAPTVFSSVSSSGAIAQLDQIPQGDSETQRTGLEINPKSLLFRAEVLVESTSAGTYNNMRLLLFRWFDDTVPVVTDILTSISGLSLWNAPYKWAGKPKYQILYDKNVQVNSNDKSTNTVLFKYKFNPKATIKYSGNVSTAIEWGNIYFLAISDSAVVTHPSVNGFVRLTYTDS